MSIRRIDKLTLLIRIIGLLLIVFALVLTKRRAGDWFFLSGTFSERYTTPLIAIRLLFGVFGLGLLIFAAKIRKISKQWDSLSPKGKIAAFTIILLIFVFILYSISVFLEEHMILIGKLPNGKFQYKIMGFMVILDANEFRTSDFITCIFFEMSLALSLVMITLHRFGLIEKKIPGQGRGTMWILFALGLFYLTLDEYYGIHEFLGNNWVFLKKISFTHHPDDMIILLYFLVALAIITKFRKYLLSSKAGLATLAVGVFFHGIGTVMDSLFDNYFLEEGVEAMASALYFGALSQYALAELLSSRRSHTSEETG